MTNTPVIPKYSLGYGTVTNNVWYKPVNTCLNIDPSNDINTANNPQTLIEFTNILNINPHIQSIATKEFTVCIECKKSFSRAYSEYVFRGNKYIEYHEIGITILMPKNSFDNMRMSGTCFARCNS
jgi:hypothetical protein